MIKPYTEVVDFLRSGNVVTGVRLIDHTSGERYECGADLVVNAVGPWSGKVANLAGLALPIRPSPGVLLAVQGRLCNMVINRLAPPGDGDIIVPQRGLSIIGTTCWLVDDSRRSGFA